MSLQKKKQQTRTRRKFRVKNSLAHNKGVVPRVSVFRSLQHISGQVIDDRAHKTVVSFSSQSLKETSGDKKETAKKVGLELGKIAQEKNIKKVFFDRGSFRYHGRVRAFAEGLRESGLEF